MSLVAALNRSITGFRGLRTNAGQAESGVGRLRTTVQSADRAVTRIKAGLDRTAQSLRGVRSGADAAARGVRQADRAMDGAGKSATRGGGLMGRMRTGLQGVTTAQRGLNTAMKANVFGAIMALLLPLITKLVEMAMQSRTVQRIVRTAFRVIGQVIGATMRVARQVVQTTWNAIRVAFQVVLRVIWTVVKTYFTIYKTIITTVIRAILAVIGPALSFLRERVPAAFRAVRDGLHRAWSGLANFTKGVFTSVLGAVKGPVNGVIGLVNSAIRALNKVKVSVPGWVPGVGGKSFGVSLPTIPTLARGGVVLPRAGGTLAVLAEAGQAEAVLPLNRLEALLTRSARPGAGPVPALGPHPRGTGSLVIEHYHEARGGSARQTAEELMFLMKARG
ncbi:hypothetical protein GCM10018785_14820 [Streptomyces longispororuber]|uniref:Uncharacterized protein n=1 Tax=Streptomyces longispororuber TaxID=68230 RepID=A0A918ZCJ8_9ACTN|nr:hypothetical protein [Streptomyces longispororuber]GHE46127.1 hypothetical protein GCM10018785_14820 [Streptomyces longispororuber]